MAASAYGTGKCAKKCTNFALLNKCIWQYALSKCRNLWYSSLASKNFSNAYNFEYLSDSDVLGIWKV